MKDMTFICEICNKVLASQSKLKRHMLVHTGNKPYSCDVCDIRFTRYEHMKRHMLNRHQGRFLYLYNIYPVLFNLTLKKSLIYFII